MKINYRLPVVQRIKDAIVTARIECRQIESIDLTTSEWNEFYHYVSMHDLIINTAKNPDDWCRNEVMYCGILIREELEEEDE